MPSRRNARKQYSQSSHVQQQPTPSSRPSPSTYPSPLPDEEDSDSIQPHSDLELNVSLRPNLLDDDSPLVSFDNNPKSPMEEYNLGHQRSPILSRDPTTLESLSRTVRSSIHTVRSSISIPTAAPSPPTVSRPVSFGSFLTGHPDEHGGGTIRPMRRPTDTDEGSPFGHQPMPSGLSQAVLSYPQNPDGTDPILWARWDTTLRARRLLFLGYSVGLQVWDCTDLGCVSEVLNIGGDEEEIEGSVVFAGVIPRSRGKRDMFEGHRLLIGVLHNSTLFSVYSLSSHRVLKQVTLPGPDGVEVGEFAVGDEWLVVSTARPPALHIFSSATFELLHTVPAAQLVAFSHLSNNDNNTNNNANDNVLLESTQHLLDNNNNNNVHSFQLPSISRSDISWPIFALRGRLLAYAAPPPKPSEGSSSSGGAGDLVGLGAGRNEVEAVAMKVGGSVLSGIKTLGGIAYKYGAKLGVEYIDSANKAPTSPPSRGGGGGTGIVGAGVSGMSRLFSKSAPAATSDSRRRFSQDGSLGGGGEVVFVTPRIAPSVENGYYVCVVDLASLTAGLPRLVTEFLAFKYQPVSKITWSGDGTSLLVVPKDGQVAKTFQIRPTPGPVGAQGAMEMSASKAVVSTQEAPWHTYSLRRGRTSAVVERASWADDGRWIAIGTKKRTVHLFTTNPYGGKPDGRSHVSGRVCGAFELSSLGMEVSPIVRLRASKAPSPDKPKIPLAFTFLDSSYLTAAKNLLPSNLLPPTTSPYLGPSPALVSSSPSNRSDPPHSPHHYKRPTNFQDILFFDPTDGVLSLRRVTLELRQTDGSHSSGNLGKGINAVSAALSAGATSISLPTTRLSVSSSVSPHSPSGLDSHMASGSARSSGLSQMMTEGATELTGKESHVATWNLQRRRDWGQLKRVITDDRADDREGDDVRRVRAKRDDWLAQAELSTFSKSTRILPRPIYLSHQFSFHTLGEDYHALIRRYQFDFGGVKIDVRREVEVSAYPDSLGGHTGESFVEGYSLPHDIRRASSSFDEPLASAISGDLEYHVPAAVLPMLPNGTSSKGPKLFTNSIPIRQTVDGMTESLGRFRREIHSRHKIKSPSFGPRSSDSMLSASVPLEFDEEDEDFMINDKKDSEESVSVSRNTSNGPSASTPATSAHPLDDVDEVVGPMGDEGETWHRWGEEEHQAVEEVERFDHISAPGFMDEEQEQERAALAAKTEKKGRGRKKRI